MFNLASPFSGNKKKEFSDNDINLPPPPQLHIGQSTASSSSDTTTRAPGVSTSSSSVDPRTQSEISELREMLMLSEKRHQQEKEDMQRQIMELQRIMLQAPAMQNGGVSNNYNNDTNNSGIPNQPPGPPPNFNKELSSSPASPHLNNHIAIGSNIVPNQYAGTGLTRSSSTAPPMFRTLSNSSPAESLHHPQNSAVPIIQLLNGGGATLRRLIRQTHQS